MAFAQIKRCTDIVVMFTVVICSFLYNVKYAAIVNQRQMTELLRIVLGPVLFLLYASGVIKLIQNCGLSAHAYADDLQVYDHVNPAQSATFMARMADCITRIGAWMASNRLCLNPAKTEVIWLGSTRRVTS